VAEWFKAAVLKYSLGRPVCCCPVSFCAVLLMFFGGSGHPYARPIMLRADLFGGNSGGNSPVAIWRTSGLANGRAGLLPAAALGNAAIAALRVASYPCVEVRSP
jgi:hypothetical protein